MILFSILHCPRDCGNSAPASTIAWVRHTEVVWVPAPGGPPAEPGGTGDFCQVMVVVTSQSPALPECCPASWAKATAAETKHQATPIPKLRINPFLLIQFELLRPTRRDSLLSKLTVRREVFLCARTTMRAAALLRQCHFSCWVWPAGSGPASASSA